VDSQAQQAQGREPNGRRERRESGAADLDAGNARPRHQRPITGRPDRFVPRISGIQDRGGSRRRGRPLVEATDLASEKSIEGHCQDQDLRMLYIFRILPILASPAA
jgi:hypothetical protein